METLIKTGDWGVGMTHGLTYGYDAFGNPQRLWEHWEQVKANEDKIWVGTFVDYHTFYRSGFTVGLPDQLRVDTY